MTSTRDRAASRHGDPTRLRQMFTSSVLNVWHSKYCSIKPADWWMIQVCCHTYALWQDSHAESITHQMISIVHLQCTYAVHIWWAPSDGNKVCTSLPVTRPKLPAIIYELLELTLSFSFSSIHEQQILLDGIVVFHSLSYSRSSSIWRLSGCEHHWFSCSLGGRGISMEHIHQWRWCVHTPDCGSFMSCCSVVWTSFPHLQHNYRYLIACKHC